MRQNPSTEGDRVAHLSIDGLIVAAIANSNIVQCRHEVVGNQFGRIVRLIEVQMSLLWHTVPNSACMNEFAMPLSTRTQNSKGALWQHLDSQPPSYFYKKGAGEYSCQLTKVIGQVVVIDTLRYSSWAFQC